MHILKEIENEYRKTVLGAESYGEYIDVVLKSGKTQGHPYYGYIPLKQARVIPGCFVKVKAVGLCSDRYGNNVEPLYEGWFILGRWVHTGVFVVVEGSRPTTFFAPVIGVDVGGA